MCSSPLRHFFYIEPPTYGRVISRSIRASRRPRWSVAGSEREDRVIDQPGGSELI
jgi:hypothetical protein